MTPTLRRVARRQGGCFTRRQALQAGMTSREVSRHLLTGEWVPVISDVLVCAGTPVTEHLRAWSAILAVGQPVALAGCSAGLAYGLERTPSPVDVRLVVPNSRDPRDLRSLAIRRVVAGQWKVVWHRGLPLTPLPATIRDIAADASLETTRDVVQHALRRRRTSFTALAGTLGRGLAGSAALRQVLEEVAPGYQVKWERMLHRAVRARGVVMKPQTKVTAPDGRTAYLDLGIEELRFGVEIDGFVNHMKRFAADRRRARMLAVELDWTIASYAVEEIGTDLAAVADEVVAYVRRLASRPPPQRTLNIDSDTARSPCPNRCSKFGAAGGPGWVGGAGWAELSDPLPSVRSRDREAT